MRFIQTIIVHLYVDTEVPGQLCGNMRSLEETGIVSFKTHKELETLLYQLIQKPRISPKINPPSCSGQPDDKEIQ